MISSAQAEEYNGNGYDRFTVYSLEPEGMEWIIQNYERLNLKVAPRPRKNKPIVDLDDEIPF